MPLQDLPAEMSRQVMRAEAMASFCLAQRKCLLQACSSDAELLCMARTKKGDRCKNAGCQGNFCRRRNEEAGSRKFMLTHNCRRSCSANDVCVGAEPDRIGRELGSEAAHRYCQQDPGRSRGRSVTSLCACPSQERVVKGVKGVCLGRSQRKCSPNFLAELWGSPSRDPPNECALRCNLRG